MSTTAVSSVADAPKTSARQADLKLEVITLPVSDFDRSKAFYSKLGWRLDADFSNGSERVIQFTPPGSPCSIHFAKSPAPGTVQGLFLVVSDIQGAREELVRQGAEVSELWHFAAGTAPFGGQESGPAPDHASYGTYATFKDPDGNGWVLQEVTTRFPGRVAGDTSYASVTDLAEALRRAEAAHGRHEALLGERDANWPAWYAEYMVHEQSGEPLPT
jgi:catechol 2,3-dioxygenase-like lactoylglutathione lyase family enzyme